MTLRDLAAACSTDIGYLSRLETGQIEPRYDTLRRLGKALGVSAASLIAGKAA